MSHFYDEITTALPELQVLKDEPMSRHTTFRIGGPADYFVCPDREQIAEVLAVAKNCGMAITVIGNGSNLLVGDKGIRGLVVEIGSAMNQIMVDKNHITAGAGALLSPVAAKAAAAELGGMEFAAGIPGSVGGAVTMNAGAYGGEMKDILRTVTVLTPEGELKTLDVSEMDLSYRHSCVPEQQYIVLEAEIELGYKPEEIRSSAAILAPKRVDCMDSIQLLYPSDRYANITCGLGCDKIHSLYIQGTKGRIYLNAESFVEAQHVTAYDFENQVLASFEEPFRANGFEYEAAAVMQALREGKTGTDLVPMDETIAVLDILDACRRQWNFRFDCEGSQMPQ